VKCDFILRTYATKRKWNDWVTHLTSSEETWLGFEKQLAEGEEFSNMSLDEEDDDE